MGNIRIYWTCIKINSSSSFCNIKTWSITNIVIEFESLRHIYPTDYVLNINQYNSHDRCKNCMGRPHHSNPERIWSMNSWKRLERSIKAFFCCWYPFDQYMIWVRKFQLAAKHYTIISQSLVENLFSIALTSLVWLVVYNTYRNLHVFNTYNTSKLQNVHLRRTFKMARGQW